MKPQKSFPRNQMHNFHEVVDFIEDKYKIKFRDYLGKFGSTGDMEKYQTATGDMLPFGGTNPATTDKNYDADMKLMHEHFARFKEWQKSNPPKEYLDYWHWLMDHHFYEVNNGCSCYWRLKEILEDPESPWWVKEITQHVYDEFKDDLPESGEMEVWIEW